MQDKAGVTIEVGDKVVVNGSGIQGKVVGLGMNSISVQYGAATVTVTQGNVLFVVRGRDE